MSSEVVLSVWLSQFPFPQGFISTSLEERAINQHLQTSRGFSLSGKRKIAKSLGRWGSLTECHGGFGMQMNADVQ